MKKWLIELIEDQAEEIQTWFLDQCLRHNPPKRYLLGGIGIMEDGKRIKISKDSLFEILDMGLEAEDCGFAKINTMVSPLLFTNDVLGAVKTIFRVNDPQPRLPAPPEKDALD
jgi:hypothetical protein